MAKRQTKIDPNLFAKTEPSQAEEPPEAEVAQTEETSEAESVETEETPAEEPAAEAVTTAVIPAPAMNPAFSHGRIVNAGVGLREGEVEALARIALEVDPSGKTGRNHITRWMVIVGLTLYEKGLLPESPRRLP